MMQEKSFRLFELIMVANIAQKNLKRIVNIIGILRELTTTYTPQQNGVSERKNRTEVVNWSIHVLNRSPTFSIQNMTPEEAWSGRQPFVDHFKIFGCIAYAHILDEKRKKLYDKAEKCVFIGVSETSKAYKLFNPLTKKIVTNRDAIFDEDNTWDWNEQQPNSIIVDNEDVKELQL